MEDYPGHDQSKCEIDSQFKEATIDNDSWVKDATDPVFGTNSSFEAMNIHSYSFGTMNIHSFEAMNINSAGSENPQKTDSESEQMQMWVKNYEPEGTGFELIL